MILKHARTLLLLCIFLACNQEKKEAIQTIEASPKAGITLTPQDSIIITPLKNKAAINFENPSFEDSPQAAHTPLGWFDCGFPNETPPDVLPNGTFKVTQSAYHGKTYIGLVTRDVNTWEGVGQKLKVKLVKDSCYGFSLNLMRSPIFESQSQLTLKTVNYTQPVILKVWGGDTACAKTDLLVESPKIDSTSWKKYSFIIKPRKDMEHIMFEIFYEKSTDKPYNGNLLLDNLSGLMPCYCPPVSK
jgi:hypothetical protein